MQILMRSSTYETFMTISSFVNKRLFSTATMCDANLSLYRVALLKKNTASVVHFIHNLSYTSTSDTTSATTSTTTTNTTSTTSTTSTYYNPS
nr:hypothetical protein HvNV107 [Heliothis virescens nudivirus]